MESAPDERRLGDYLLKEALEETSRTITWLAEQVSVQRPVFVEELRTDDAEEAAVFLADVRAKAAVDLPVFASVYEAVSTPGLCFSAHEILAGESLGGWRGKPFEPVVLARMLRRIAEANAHLERLGTATAPLALGDVHPGEGGAVRLRNPAVAGERDPSRSAADIGLLGRELPALAAQGRPGSGRLMHLLAWMRGEQAPMAIGWEEVRGFCEKIERQLAEAGPSRGRKAAVWLLALLGLAAAVFLVLRPGSGEEPVAVKESVAPIEVAAGVHAVFGGEEKELEAFRLSGAPVTVGEYAAFLKTLKVLEEGGKQEAFDHPLQPAGKRGHEPDGWPVVRNGGDDRPVTGVDWWDAAAYATWRKGRLPTQDEWFAALGREKEPGIFEWVEDASKNPANPLGDEQWVIVRPGAGGPRREWLEDRATRRKDVGFRVAGGTP